MSAKGLRSSIFCLAFLALPLVTAQQRETVAKPLTPKQRAQKEAQLKKEAASGWDKWINEDVAWIVSDDEKRTFHELSNDEEREQFVEQFWLRRDPTPDTVENEYKEEHYRRIAYANEHFASGIPGWRTDRGRTYIRFGPPDSIEAHPSGGSYERPASEGGGETSTYPFEQWRYRHLDNVGEDVVVEFVDTTMTGEYRMTVDPCEKDALTYVPNTGLTLAEQQGLSTKLARFQNTDGTHCGAPLGGKPESDNEFSRMERLVTFDKPPAVKFSDLEAAVTSHVRFNVLPMMVRVDYLRLTDFSVLANITIQFDNRDLQFESKDGVAMSRVELLGHVYTMTRRTAATIEKALEIPAPQAMLQEFAARKSIYQESLPLAPGKYKLALAAKDTVSGNMATMELALDVPRYQDGELSASSLILADSIEMLPVRSVGGAMFSIGDPKVRPRLGGEFRRDETMWIYLQVYSSALPGSAAYEIDRTGTGAQAMEFTDDLNVATIERLLPIDKLPAGAYILKLKVTAGGQSVARETPFTVLP